MKLPKIPILQSERFTKKQRAYIVLLTGWAVMAFLVIKNIYPPLTVKMMTPIFDLIFVKLTPFMAYTYFVLTYITLHQEQMLENIMDVAHKNFLMSWGFFIILALGVLFVGDIIFTILGLDPVFYPAVMGWVESRV